jgi:hypothetical protein
MRPWGDTCQGAHYRPRMSAEGCSLRLRAVLASLVIAVVAMLAPAVASAAPGDIGVEDFNYAPIGGSPTGPKP